MPGYLLTVGSTLMCAHAGTATPTSPNPRVRADSQPIVTQTTTYVIAGCTLTPSGSPFCVTGQFVSAAMRVRAGGVPVLLQDSQSICSATGNPMTVVQTQFRVKAT
jgi:hypothetical protein